MPAPTKPDSDSGVSRIGFGSYPDGHAFIERDALSRALHDKQKLLDDAGVQGLASTQMCFDVEGIRAWLREERDRLHLMLKDLDATDRAAVIMRYWYDYSEVEIAESLNLTVSAVKSRLHRSRRALAEMWQDEKSHAYPKRRSRESLAF